MIGMLLWKPPGKREKAVQVRERSILHTRFFCAEITRGPKTPEVALRRRVASAVKRLRRQNITQVVLPEDFPYLDQLTKGGLRPVSTPHCGGQLRRTGSAGPCWNGGFQQRGPGWRCVPHH